MSKDYEIYIDRLAENSIIMKGQINDVVFGLKGITDKLDTLIALKQVELSLLQQQRLPQQWQPIRQWMWAAAKLPVWLLVQQTMMRLTSLNSKQ